MTTKIETRAKPDITKAVVQWKGEAIPITFNDVKTLICPPATDQEVAIFLKTCQSLQLNPFANECFLIKYDVRDKASFVIAIDAYLKAAEANPDYDGCEAGIILKDSGGKLELREGAFLLDEEKTRLVGGWAKVFRKDRSRPTYVAVTKTECVKLTREGRPTKFWAEPNQPWMLRKSALKRALVEAFPSLFAGTLATAEVAPETECRLTEGEMPQAFANGDGGPAWPHFWVKVQDELGLTENRAHQLLQVESLKELLEQGRTLEDVWLMLVEKVRDIQESEPPLPLDDRYTEGFFDDPMPENDAPPSLIDMDWLRDTLIALPWPDVGKWLRERYGVQGASVRVMVESLTPEQQAEFVAEVGRRAEAK